MVILVILAAIGVLALLSVAFWALDKYCPKVSNKIKSSVESVFSSFKKKELPVSTSSSEEVDK